MSITNYAAYKILDNNFGVSAFTPPATMWFGLSTHAIAIDGTGAIEPVVGSYARASFANNKTNWGDATLISAVPGLINDVAISFVESTADWGTITHVFIADAVTGGNIWWFEALSPSRVVQTATTVQFAIGAITVQMTNA